MPTKGDPRRFVAQAGDYQVVAKAPDPMPEPPPARREQD